MVTDVGPAERALDALGDPTRRRVLELVREGPVSVGEIAGRLPVSRPAVSKHLKVLGDSGLVTHVKVGTRSLYRINASGLSAARDYLDSLWTDVLEAFADHVEATRPDAAGDASPVIEEES
jgi:DNA-binding transcriptional ArsR family regulator